MNAAGVIMDCDHHYCAAHTLELTTGKCFNFRGSDVLSKARALVGHFKSSSQANDTLLKTQASAPHPQTVVADVATRWWSTYNMCNRLLQLKIYFHVMSEQHGLTLNLNDAEWGELKLINDLLKPFMHIQRILEGEKYVTGSLVLLLISIARNNLKKMVALNSPLLGDQAAALLSDFNSRWGDGIVNVFTESVIRQKRNRIVGIPRKLILAAAVDPRTKNLFGIPETELELVWQAVIDSCVNYALRDPVIATSTVDVTAESSNSSGISNDTNSSIATDDIWLEEVMEQGQNSSPQTNLNLNPADVLREEVKSEIFRYRQEPLVKLSRPDSNPLEWWKINQSRFPHVARLARSLLCIPATSASSERIFSEAGLTISKKRARLTHQNATSVIMLKTNRSSVNEYCDRQANKKRA